MTSGTVKPEACVPSKLFVALFHDISYQLPSPYLNDDLVYLLNRLEREGNNFIYSDLPALGKAVEKGVVEPTIPIEIPKGFRLRKGTRLPVFLNSLLIRVFYEDGLCRFDHNSEVTDDEARAFFFLRQICLLYSKVNAPSEDKDTVAIRSFFDRVTAKKDIKISSDVANLARYLIRSVVEGDSEDHIALRMFNKHPFGKHGPGAVAGKEAGAYKWEFSSWRGINNELFRFNANDQLPDKGNTDQPYGRVVAVPKDFRGPRVICIEPKENQFAQQGIMKLLYSIIPHHRYAGRAISFIKVDRSRDLCSDRNIATIDLKDASDNLSLSLARLLFPKWFFETVTRYRTRAYKYKDEVIHPLCLASMGNATCFPLQTLVFWAIALSTMSLIKRSHKCFRSLDMRIRVFGDDIMVPLWAADAVCEELTRCGLVINTAKTCMFSNLRESCGRWVFGNKDVDIIRCQQPRVVDYRSWLEYEEYSYNAYKKGLNAFYNSLYDLVTDFYSPIERWDRNIQCKVIRKPSIVIKGLRTELSGYTRFYAWHVANDLTPFLKGARKLVKMRWVVPTDKELLLYHR